MSKFFETDEEVATNIKAIQSGVSEKFQPSLPILSSGQTVFAAQPTMEKVGSTDVMMLAGGGIIGHPLGAAAGVRSLRQSWEADTTEQALTDFGQQLADAGDFAVARAVEKFGAMR